MGNSGESHYEPNLTFIPDKALVSRFGWRWQSVRKIIAPASDDDLEAEDRPSGTPDLLAIICLGVGIGPMKRDLPNVGRPIRGVNRDDTLPRDLVLRYRIEKCVRSARNRRRKSGMASEETDIFQADYCSQRLKSLSDPLRLRIAELLLNGEMTVSDIAGSLETELVTVSHHLQILKNAQIAVTRREGRFIYYRLHESVTSRQTKSRRTLDLGCCKLEVPRHISKAPPVP